MIYRIRIQNFKSLRDVTVELSPVTVFIGRSGTGKTNFVSAIRFLRDYLLAGRVPDYAKHHETWRCATNPYEPTEFCVEFTLPTIPMPFSYTLRLAPAWNEPPILERLTVGAKTVYCQVRRVTVVEEATRRPVQWGEPQWETVPRLIYSPEPGLAALGRLPGMEEVVLAHTALTAGIGVYNFPHDVLLRKQDAAGFGLADRGENYLTVLRQLVTNLECIDVRKAIVATLQKLNPTVVSVELDSIQNPQNVIVGHRFGDKILTLYLAQESDGFRRLYAHLLALNQRPPKQTLVFEEPENGIYPAALELLAQEFRAAPEARLGQVLLTTHSPVLLDNFSDEEIRVVDLIDLETRIGSLAEEQRASLREQLLRPGELLTVESARLANGVTQSAQ